MSKHQWALPMAGVLSKAESDQLTHLIRKLFAASDNSAMFIATVERTTLDRAHVKVAYLNGTLRECMMSGRSFLLGAREAISVNPAALTVFDRAMASFDQLIGWVYAGDLTHTKGGTA